MRRDQRGAAGFVLHAHVGQARVRGEMDVGECCWRDGRVFRAGKVMLDQGQFGAVAQARSGGANARPGRAPPASRRRPGGSGASRARAGLGAQHDAFVGQRGIEAGEDFVGAVEAAGQEVHFARVAVREQLRQRLQRDALRQAGQVAMRGIEATIDEDQARRVGMSATTVGIETAGCDPPARMRGVRMRAAGVYFQRSLRVPGRPSRRAASSASRRASPRPAASRFGRASKAEAKESSRALMSGAGTRPAQPSARCGPSPRRSRALPAAARVPGRRFRRCGRRPARGPRRA